MCKRFREDLARTESENGRRVETMERKWKQERTEWMEGCDAVQTAHRIAHLKTALLLDAERRSVLDERDERMKERLARMQREYKILLFQVKEDELEERLEELQEEFDDFRADATYEKQRLMASHKQVVQQWKDKCVALISRLKEKEAELGHSQTEVQVSSPGALNFAFTEQKCRQKCRIYAKRF